MDCLLCGKKLNVLRQLHGEEFCSATHRKAYLKKQNDSAVDYLIHSKPRYKGEPLSAADAVPESESAPETRADAIPFAANFLAGRMFPARVASHPLFHAACGWAPLHAVLPAAAQIESGKLRSCAFSRPSVGGCGMRGRIENQSAAPLEFPMPPPAIAARWLHPMWMGAGQAEAVQHRHAGFVKPIIGRMRIEPGAAYPAAVPPFAFPPLFLNAASVLSGPVLRFATAARRPGEMARRRGHALPLALAAWSSTDVPLRVPPADVAPAACRFRAGACIRSVPSPREVPPRCLPASTAYHGENEAPQVPTLLFSTHRALLKTALRLRLSVPRHVIAAGASSIRGPAALVWELRLHLPAGRIPVIRPEFTPLARDYPVQPPESASAAPAETPRVNSWQRLSAAKRRLIVTVPLALALLAPIIRLVTLAPVNAREGVYARIHARAAIDLQDDFRSGLSRWTGVPGWAETWSYDPTGFARPGRLALFAHATPVTDYRLDFLAQIDNKSVSWVFRASDVHNYYVTKLLQSKSAANPEFSIVRYAVTGGREGPKTHLPLPFAAPVRRMFWVREEIRGADFTTYIDGQVIDTWTDASLAHGGIGFFSDSGEAAYIRSVQVAENNDLLGKLCSLLAPAERK